MLLHGRSQEQDLVAGIFEKCDSHWCVWRPRLCGDSEGPLRSGFCGRFTDYVIARDVGPDWAVACVAVALCGSGPFLTTSWASSLLVTTLQPPSSPHSSSYGPGPISSQASAHTGSSASFFSLSLSSQFIQITLIFVSPLRSLFCLCLLPPYGT